MTSTLYISYTGLLDPLGQSQVLQYVLALSKRGHQITVLSFEKPSKISDEIRFNEIRQQLKSANVSWFPRVWHNRPIGILATLYDVIFGQRQAVRLARDIDAQVVHCRSYIAGLMGLAVKHKTGARFVFDMRGFWPDERVDGGIWKKSSMRYRVFKWIEKKLFMGADHVVSLTRSGVREFNKFDYLRGQPPPSSVIPTCTNLDLFQPKKIVPEEFTLGYIGSVGSWYLFNTVAAAVARTFEMKSNARFLVVTRSSHSKVRNLLSHAGVDLERVKIASAEYSEMPNHVARMSAGLFFIRPAWSKRASCPTRMGEFLACGKPILSNGGVGDVAEIIAETGCGIALPADGLEAVSLDELDKALEQLFEMTADPDMVNLCRLTSNDHFSLTSGVAEYDRIYNRLGANL